MTSYDENPCWEELPGFGEVVSEDYDDEDLHDALGKCEYCGGEPWLWLDGTPHTDPFGGRITCRPCFIQIISGEDDGSIE